MASVSGRVTYSDGSAITGAVRKINFVPAQDTTAEVRKAASGEIAPDGSFEAWTRKPGDGVFKGKYVVTFTILKDPNYGGSLVPERYTFAEDSPFTVEVVSDVTDLVYEIDKE